MNSNKKTARIAGVLYLILALTGLFAEMFVRAKIRVWEDAALTTQNIIESEGLYRLGFVSDLIMATVWIFLALALYNLFKEVNKKMAQTMVVLVVVGAAITFLNMLNYFAPLILLNGDHFKSIFETDQLQGLVMFFVEMHSTGYAMGSIFFGLWLFPFGYLAYQSGFFPRILGVFLMLGCFGYLASFLIIFFFPEYIGTLRSIITLPADIGEVSAIFWLLIKGVKEPKPAKQLAVG